jgi:signal transduction histidine kinase
MTIETIDQDLIIQLFDAQPQAVLWFRPVRDNRNAVIDFEYGYVNEEATRYARTTREKIIGVRVSESYLLDDDYRRKVVEELKYVYETGERVNGELYNAVLKRHVKLQRSRIGDGVLTIVQDRTAEHELMEELKRREAFTESILDTSIHGIFVASAVRDPTGRIIDLLMEKVNPAYTRIINLTEAETVGKRFSELFPTAMVNGTFQKNVEVLETGIPTRWQMHYTGESLNAWYDISASKLDDRIVVNFADITSQKVAQITTEQQKNFLNSILQYSPSGISVTEVIRDEQGNVIDGRTIISNEIAHNYTGIRVGTNQTIRDIDPAILESPLYKMALQTLETGAPFHTQYYLEGPDKWLELSVSRLDADHLINVFSDITETKKAQLEIENAAHTLRTVIDAAQTGMFTAMPLKNSEGKIIDFRFLIVNTTVGAYAGKTADELTGRQMTEVFPGYMESGLFDMYCDTFYRSVVNRREIHYTADGLDVFLDVQSARIGNEVLATFTDFTPLRRTQQELEQSITELKKSNASLEEFSYAASHDLQEPLRKVYTFSDRLQSRLADRLDEQEKQMFERMNSATVRMRALIDDLLTFSQVGIHTQMEPVDLNEVVQEVLSDMEIAIEQKEAIISVDRLPKIRGNRRQLKQVFQNLTSNSLKYSRAGVRPELRLTSRLIPQDELPALVPESARQGPFHLLELRDNGIGFEPENAERIFKIFQRLHGKSEYSGTGVGLAITKKVVDSHGGYIHAAGNPGAGAIFRIYLPVNQ